MISLKIKIEDLNSFLLRANVENNLDLIKSVSSIDSITSLRTNEIEIIFNSNEILVKNADRFLPILENLILRTPDHQVVFKVSKAVPQEDEALTLLQKLSPELTLEHQLKTHIDKEQFIEQEPSEYENHIPLSSERLPEALSFLYTGLKPLAPSRREISLPTFSQNYMHDGSEIIDVF